MASAKTVAFHTLGCKLNFSETSSMSRLLAAEGFEKREFNENADVYVINTCSVTDNADKECRHLVRRIQRKSPESLIVITGCYAQLKPKEIAAIPGVNLVLGAAEKFNIATHLRELSRGDSARICSCDVSEIEEFHSSWSMNDRTRTFLKVQDGCDYNCSFCTIPMARGKSRSDTISNVVQRANEIASQGVKEIVLTGVNLGDFKDSKFQNQNPKFHDSKFQNANSKSQDDKLQITNSKSHSDFFDLVQALENVKGIERFRISSIEPNLLSNEIISFVANSDKFMPHFHIPLQSGSNKILGMMRRRYRRELYAERVQLIKTLMPHCAIGVDVIVGFPGETDEEFKTTFDFLHSLDITYLHVFTYSERDNTHALSLAPVVPVHVRNERNKTLRNLSYMKQQFFNEQHAGQTRKVLFEIQDKNGMMEGYTDNYIKVTTAFRPEWVNSIVDWKL